MAENQDKAGNDNLDPGKKQQAAATGKDGAGDLPEREWVKPLSEPLQTAKTLRKFTDDNPIEQIAKAYIALEGKLGKSVAVPDENASAEEWDQFWSHIGRPKSADDYDVPEDFDKEIATKFRERALKSGATKKQAHDFADFFLNAAKDADVRRKAVLQRNAVDAQNVLKEEFKDKFDKKMEAYRVGMAAMFPEKIEKTLKDSGIADDVEFMKAVIGFGERFGESEFVHGAPAAASKATGYAAYQKSHAYMDKYKS